jgi:hypothetical protein
MRNYQLGERKIILFQNRSPKPWNTWDTRNPEKERHCMAWVKESRLPVTAGWTSYAPNISLWRKWRIFHWKNHVSLSLSQYYHALMSACFFLNLITKLMLVKVIQIMTYGSKAHIYSCERRLTDIRNRFTESWKRMLKTNREEMAMVVDQHLFTVIGEPWSSEHCPDCILG